MSNKKTVSSASLDVEISGKVTDEKGEGLPGVNIVVEGTQTGFQTDGSGNYRISITDGSATLVYTFIGYVSQEVNITNDSKEINI